MAITPLWKVLGVKVGRRLIGTRIFLIELLRAEKRIRNVNLHRDRVHKVVPTANYS